MSTQLDFVIADTSLIPAINLSGDNAFIPIESAIMAFEVKSKLRSDYLVQLQKQEERLLELRPLHVEDSANPQAPPPFKQVLQFVVAFDTDVSIDTLSEWIKETSGLMGICVIGKFFIYKRLQKRSPLIQIVNEPDSEFQETLAFISTVMNGLYKVDRVQGNFYPI